MRKDSSNTSIVLFRNIYADILFLNWQVFNNQIKFIWNALRSGQRPKRWVGSHIGTPFWMLSELQYTENTSK